MNIALDNSAPTISAPSTSATLDPVISTNGVCGMSMPTAAASTSTSAAMKSISENGGSVASASDNAVALGAGYAIFVGEQIGIADLPADVAADIMRFVSRLMRAVLAMAKKFKDRARRRMLTVDDLEAAAIFFGISAQYGYKMSSNCQFKQVGSGGDELFVCDDKEMDLRGFVGANMPKLPLQATVKSHWLVIDGVQPAIPENPVPPASASEDGAPNGTVEDGNAEDGTANGVQNGRPAPMLLNVMARGVRKTEQVQIKTMTTHALSLEQQIFFKEVTEAIMGGDESKRLEALNCLMVDSGLQALLPRFSITIAEGVRCNIAQHNLAILIYLMRMTQSLVQNETLSLERCLHELLPAIMSCILSRQLCSLESDSHWALREFSARLLSVIVKKYEHPVLQSRITKALSRAFNDPNSSLATLYGAVFALNQLGADTTRAVVAVKADSINAAIRRVVNDPNVTPAEMSAANRLRGEMNSCMSAIERNVAMP